MRKRFMVVCLVTVCAGWHVPARGQDNLFFSNLDFEGVTATNLVPGWTAYIGNTAQAGVLYNDLPLAWQPGVALFGPGWQPIEGT